MLTLIKSPNIVLKQRAESWDFETDTNARDLEVDMVQFMVQNKGRGLAANQIGLLKRVFAIQLDGEVPFCMFNPEIISYAKDSIENEEGCLSFPDLWLKVKRPGSIDAKYFDRDGKECTITLKGMDAVCFQHELDHLDGKTFDTHVSQLKLALAIKKQRKHNGRTKR
jgi:peptide deformylase